MCLLSWIGVNVVNRQGVVQLGQVRNSLVPGSFPLSLHGYENEPRYEARFQNGFGYQAT